MRDIKWIAHALGGEAHGPDRVQCPAPGHSPKDRGLSILFNGNDETEFVVKGFGRDGDRWQYYKDYVRGVLGQRAWEQPRNSFPQRQPRSPIIAHQADDADKARGLWSRGRSVGGSPAETYLIKARGLRGPFSATLRYLPASKNYPCALMAALGVAEEHGDLLTIATSAIRAVQITALRPDGSGKADVPSAKKLIGRNAMGSPVIVAQPNDLLGLAITEGVEDALSIHEATGLGAWASCGANRLPALADAVPVYIDCVTIYADEDQVGFKSAMALIRGLAARRIYAQIKRLGASTAS
jgi:hypothetical protein